MLVSAESYINDALATYQSVHGPEHQKTLELQDDLAKIMIRTERHSVCMLGHRTISCFITVINIV